MPKNSNGPLVTQRHDDVVATPAAKGSDRLEWVGLARQCSRFRIIGQEPIDMREQPFHLRSALEVSR